MHDPIGTNDNAAVRFTNRLVPEANTENRNRASPTANQWHADARLRRRARARGDDDRLRRQVADGFNVDGVVPTNLDLGSELAEVLNEVVGEGVVVVENEKHFGYWLLVKSEERRSSGSRSSPNPRAPKPQNSHPCAVRRGDDTACEPASS